MRFCLRNRAQVKPLGHIEALRDNDRIVPPLGPGVHVRANRLPESKEGFSIW